MNSGIGSLLIELGINSAAFQEGMTKATYQMKAFGRDLQNTFRQLGQSTSELAAAFGVLGPAGAEIAGALNLAGQAAGNMIRSMASMNKVFGGVLAAGAGIVALFSSIAVSTIGLVVHTDENIKRMKEQAVMAGMSLQAFSGLSYAFGKSGVSAEAFASSMARFGVKLTQAAQGSRTAQSAFSTMGFTTADLEKSANDTSFALMKVSDWFHKTTDSAVKNNITMQIGGRGMKQLAEGLNMGSDAIKDYVAEAQVMGLIVTDQQAKMAKEFVNSLDTIKKSVTGVANQIADELTPSLWAAARAIVDALKSPDSQMKLFIEGLVDITQAFVDMVTAAVGALGEIGVRFRLLGDQAMHFYQFLQTPVTIGGKPNLSGLKQAWNDMEALNKLSAEDAEKKSNDIWVKAHGVMRGTEPKAPPEIHTTAARKPGDLTGVPKELPDETKKFIEALEREAISLRNVAAAAGQSAAEFSQMAAAQKSQDEIEKRFASLAAKGDALRSELKQMTDAKKKLEEPSKEGKEEDAEGRKQQIIVTQQQIAAKQRLLAENKKEEDELAAAVPHLIELAQERAASENLITAAKKLQSEGEKIDQEIADQQTLTEAYRAGGDAIVKAQAVVALKEQAIAIKKAREEAEEFARTNRDDVDGIKKHNEAVQAEKDIYDKLIVSKMQSAAASLETATAQDVKKSQDHVAAIEAEIRMIGMRTDEKIRAQAVEAALAYKREHPGATAPEMAAAGQAALEVGLATEKKTQAELAGRLDVVATYDTEKERLDKIIADVHASDGVRLEAQAELFKKTQQTREELDKMAMASGNMGIAMKGWIDSLAAEVPKLGDDLVGDLGKALSQFNSSLDELITKGRVNFRALGQSIAKDFLQTGLKGAEGLMAKSLLGAGGPLGAIGSLFGIGGKPDGTETNPMYVVDLGVGGGASSAISGAGGIMSGLLGMLPFRASGGDVTPGRAYVVGEEHPEFFVPRASGTVVPTLKTGDGPMSYTTNVHFHGVADADSFKRSQSQIMSHIGNSVAQGMGRK